MELPDWDDVVMALAALAVVLVPMLLARWLIGRAGDPPADHPDDARPRPDAGAAPPLGATRSDSTFCKRQR